MTVSETIYSNLSVAFKPKKLEIVDESHKHAGHVGWRESGETHFKIIISAEPFSGQSRLERTRAVMKTSGYEEMNVHAIEIVFEAA